MAEVCADVVCEPSTPQGCEDDALFVCNESGTGSNSIDCRATGQFCDGQADPPRCRDRVCEPGQAECDGNTARACNDRGTDWNETACGDEALCIDGQCAPVICEPNSVGCSDNATAFVCNGNGTAQDELPCDDGQYCLDAACFDRVCEPDAVGCEGDVLTTCDELGAEQTVVDCNTAGPDCADNERGCACVTDGCVPRICEPNLAECVGNASRVCNESGTGYGEIERCGEEGVCIRGECRERICEPESILCEDDVLQTCDGTGTVQTPLDCQAARSYCDADGDVPVCARWACTPSEAYCDGNAIVECDARGTGQADVDPVDCGDDYCVRGECVEDPCAAAESVPGAVGCRFYAIDLENIEGGRAPATGIAIVNLGVDTLTATLTDSLGETFGEATLEVGAGAVLDGREGQATEGTGINDTPLLLTTDQPVAAWQFNSPLPTSFTSDASLLLPIHSLGTDYIATSWRHRQRALTLQGFVAIVAVEDGTIVSITPTADVAEGEDFEAIPAGETFTVEMDAGQLLTLTTAGPDGADLTGSVITATEPIAVFGGHVCGNVPNSDTNFCDHLEEQLPPVEHWGSQFVIGRIAQRTDEDFELVRVVAAEDDTALTWDPPREEEMVLAAGEYVDVTPEGAAVLTASAPVLVTAFTRSQQAENSDGQADPSMVVLAPTQSWTRDLTVHVVEGWEVSRAIIFAPIEAEITLDGELLAVEAIGIGESGYVQFSLELEAGTHTLAADLPIHATIYGAARSTSYAAPATSAFTLD